MKAMLLAAGRGARLKPLTNDIPKPLLSVGPYRLIEHNLCALKQAGIDEVVINVCYHAKKIIECVGDGRRYGLTIEYSYEQNTPLGTGGGIYQALTLLGEAPFIVISADIWSQFEFSSIILNATQEAHVVLVENPSFHTQGDYALSEAGQVMLQGRKLTYAGIAKLDPKLFNHCQPGVFSLSPLLNAAIARGAVSGELYRGDWFNVGTIEELHRLTKKLAGHPSHSIGK